MSPYNDSRFSTQTDEELASEAAAGKLECFEELVSRHGARILRFLARKTISVEDAEDLTQETFVKAYRKIDRFDPSRKFTSWLFTIAYRIAVSHARKHYHAWREEEEPEPVDLDDPSRQAAKRENRKNIWEFARRSLSDEHFTVLWLKYAEVMDIKEIADVTETSVSNVKVRLHRARKALAERIRQLPSGKDGYTDEVSSDTHPGSTICDV